MHIDILAMVSRRFLGLGILVVAILAWFIGWIKDKLS